VIYLDTCALVKLIRAEAETAALGAFIDAHPDTRWFTSEIARTELARTVRRTNHHDQGVTVDGEQLRAELGHIERLCDGLDLVPVSSRLLREAAALESPFLPTLDAIHLSTAAGLRESLTAFLTYDNRLAAAAKDVGLPVAAPA
jgi:predicted nucleic acid-binding protein